MIYPMPQMVNKEIATKVYTDIVKQLIDDQMVLLDMIETTIISPDGLNTLLAGFRSIRSKEYHFKIINVPDYMNDILIMVEMDDLIKSSKPYTR